MEAVKKSLVKFTAQQLREIESDIEDKIESGGVPQTLYKFRMWDSGLEDNILKTLRIRLSSPIELNADYPETILPVDESLITEENMMKVAISDAQKWYPNLTYSHQLFIAYQLREKMTIDNVEQRQAAYMEIRIRNSEIRGVFCATPYYEFMDQWERLAGEATGYAVGLDTKKVYMNEGVVLGSAAYVEYYDEANPPKVPPYNFTEEEVNKNTHLALYNIPNRFAHEREYRIVRTNLRYDETGRVAKYTEDERMVQLKPEDYKEILLGIDISNQDKEQIKQVRDRKLKDTPIYETIEDNDKVVKGEQI